MNCSFCASPGAAIAELPSAASAIPMCLPIIDFPPLMGRTARAAPRAARRLWRRRARPRIFVVRCGLPSDPPVGGHSCNGGMIPRFHRPVCDLYGAIGVKARVLYHLFVRPDGDHLLVPT